MNNLSQTPYDSTKDLQNNISSTCQNIEPVYEYSTAKDVNYTGKIVDGNLVLNETKSQYIPDDPDGLFWFCPQCHEFNTVTVAQCPRCGYVKTINT